MLQPQKGERLRFSLATFLPVLPRKPPEPDQPCLIFVQLQPEFVQSPLQFSKIAFCLLLSLEAKYGIVGLAYDRNVATRALPPLVCPLVQHIMQVHVAEQR
jgi:hypothetical protein